MIIAESNFRYRHLLGGAFATLTNVPSRGSVRCPENRNPFLCHLSLLGRHGRGIRTTGRRGFNFRKATRAATARVRQNRPRAVAVARIKLANKHSGPLPTGGRHKDSAECGNLGHGCDAGHVESGNGPSGRNHRSRQPGRGVGGARPRARVRTRERAQGRRQLRGRAWTDEQGQFRCARGRGHPLPRHDR